MSAESVHVPPSGPSSVVSTQVPVLEIFAVSTIFSSMLSDGYDQDVLTVPLGGPEDSMLQLENFNSQVFNYNV